MRALRLSLAGMVVLVVLGGLMSAALAASAPSSKLVTPVTGVLASQTTDDSEEEFWEEPYTVFHARGFKQVQTVEWSDPRLPTERQTVVNFDMYHLGYFREAPFTVSLLLSGPDGYWTGTSTGFCDNDVTCNGIDLLTGHGAYAGLHATLLAQTIGDTGMTEWNGLIFEGEPLPMPDPVEPPAG